MSRSSQLELHAPDSQVFAPQDLVSLPSEPPDIRNWFSSYIYKSPEPNTLDGLQDCDGSGETCVEEEENGKSMVNEPVSKPEDGLPAALNESSDGVVVCNESDEYSESAAMVTGSSESLSLSSVTEPPDIANWFSSYLYESPQLDATYDFTLSGHECEENKICNAEKSFRQDKEDVMDTIGDENHKRLPSRSRISDVVVKCTNVVKDSKLDDQTVCKACISPLPFLCQDGLNVYLKPTPSRLSQLTYGKFSEQLFPRQRTGNNTHCSVRKSGNTNTYNKSYEMKLDCGFIDRTSPEILNIGSNTGNLDERTVHIQKSIGKKDHAHDSIEKEHLHEIVSLGNVDKTVLKADSWRRPSDRRSIGKENDETESGFISTRRKNRQENTGKIKRHAQVDFESFRNGVAPALNCDKVARVSRKVLSEASNLQFPDVLESTGIWRCPRKNKPDPGPPLKQLRLEQWVRRV